MQDFPSPSNPSGQDSHSNVPFPILWQSTEGKQGSLKHGPIFQIQQNNNFPQQQHVETSLNAGVAKRCIPLTNFFEFRNKQ